MEEENEEGCLKLFASIAGWLAKIWGWLKTGKIKSYTLLVVDRRKSARTDVVVVGPDGQVHLADGFGVVRLLRAYVGQKLSIQSGEGHLLLDVVFNPDSAGRQLVVV